MKEPTTRSRETVYHLGTWSGRTTTTNLNTGNSNTNQGSGSLEQIKGRQITVSEGHPFKQRPRKGNALGDVGGDFFTQRTYVVPLDTTVSQDHRKTATSSKINTLAGGVQQRISGSYTGPIWPIQPSSTFGITTPNQSQKGYPPPLNSSNAQLDALGASAVAKCKPTNSVADASVFLGELFREGLPALIGHTLWKDKTSLAKKASSEYLNSEFGWKPIISDMRKFAYAVNHANTVLEQYERDSGRQVRRQYHFPVLRSSEVTTLSTGIDPYGPSQWGGSTLDGTSKGDVVRVREKTQRRWFSGAFTYHMPSGYGGRAAMARHAQEAKKLLGLSLTPDVVWNLSPWSWAIDWFTNTGDVVSNITDWAIDGLVMRYGYIMEHTIVKDTYTHGPPKELIPSRNRATPLTFVTETKIRRRANPFGFGLTFDGLTIRQQAISLALGLTRW